MVQPLWKTVWWILTQLSTDLPYDPAIPRLGVHPRQVTTYSRKNLSMGASLVAQWLGIRLPMQGTRVRALVREDPTCRGATRPVRHNY